MNIICQMNVYANIFSSESMSNSEHVMVLLTFWDKFHSNLKEKQSKCLNKIKWGEPVLTGKHALSTLDRKRVGKNILDCEENALSGDEESISKEQVPSKMEDVSVAVTKINVNIPEEHGKCSSPDLNKRVLRLPKMKIKLSETHNKELDKNIADDKSESVGMKRSTRLSMKRLCNKKQVNKENVISGVRPNLLPRKRLFKNTDSVSETSPTCWTSILCHSLNDTPKTEPMYSKLGQEVLPHFSENISDINSAMDKMEFKSSLPTPEIQKSPVKKSSIDEPSTLSPIELVEPPKHECQKLSKSVENNSSDEEIPSSSPTFPSKFLRNYKDSSNMVQNAKEQRDIGSDSKKRGKKPRTKFKKSSEEPEITDKCDTKSDNKILPHVTDKSNKDKEVLTNLQKRKWNMQEGKIKNNKKLKLPQKKPTVQCPLCCDWFKPKVIESHAANCGMFTRRELRTTPVSQQIFSDDEPTTGMLLGCDANSKLLSEISENSADVISNDATNCEMVVDNSSPNALASDIKQTENLSIANKILNESRSEVNTYPVPAALDRDQQSQGNGDRLKIVKPILDLPSISVDTHKIIQSDMSKNVTQELPERDFTEISSKNTYSTKVSVEHWKTNMEQKSTNVITKEKRCYICDATYGDDSLFTMHLKSCQQKYKKLKQKFENKYKKRETHRITRKQPIAKCPVPSSDADVKQKV